MGDRNRLPPQLHHLHRRTHVRPPALPIPLVLRYHPAPSHHVRLRRAPRYSGAGLQRRHQELRSFLFANGGICCGTTSCGFDPRCEAEVGSCCSSGIWDERVCAGCSFPGTFPPFPQISPLTSRTTMLTKDRPGPKPTPTPAPSADSSPT